MLKHVVMFASVALLTGCKGPPVQEMSDARQAIAAARAAGAAERAPTQLDAAQAAILKAEEDLHQAHFTRARMAAQEAKRRAAEALANSQGTPARPN